MTLIHSRWQAAQWPDEAGRSYAERVERVYRRLSR